MPMPAALQAMQRHPQGRQTGAPPAVTIYNLVVRNEEEAQRKKSELEQMEGAVVNIVTRQILGGSTPVNRALQMVHGSGRR
jgi:hypothetical protein